MKKFYLMALFASTTGYSQEVLDKIANEMCDCIKTSSAQEKVNSSSLQNEFVNCFMKSYMTHSDDINAVEKLDFTNEEQMSKFGEKVAIQMVKFCPESIIALGRAAIEGEEFADGDEDYLSLDGEVVEIVKGDFMTLRIKDANSRTHNLLLLYDFDNAAVLYDNKLKKKDKVGVSYSEMELYDPKLKEFRNYKVLGGITKK